MDDGRGRKQPFGTAKQPPRAPSGYAPVSRREPPSYNEIHHNPHSPQSSEKSQRTPGSRVPPQYQPNDFDSTPRTFIVQTSEHSHVYLNKIIVALGDFPPYVNTIMINNKFIFSIETGRFVEPGNIAASKKQREWARLESGQPVSVSPFDLETAALLSSVDLEIDFIKSSAEPREFKADALAERFYRSYVNQAFTIGQIIVFDFEGINMMAGVAEVQPMDIGGKTVLQSHISGIGFGRFTKDTEINFITRNASKLRIKQSNMKSRKNAILTPNFKFEDMGIGGLDKEFSDIFRRAFASRIFPPLVVEKLGISHVKGILLYGPPGTGKTLIARQIGKMLNARDPKIVNGPEILSKYVGQSEENIRKLFADAESEYKELGDESSLHIIIFDELDAICRQRGSKNDGTGVGDTVVNQLLSKMDGVDQLNNILIIGMTNRKDMIDEALLRPGRLEVHVEISLPDEHGRLQIIKIHTATMRKNDVIDYDVNLDELAAMTKNFSGAEISGLVKSATSFSFTRHVQVGTMAGVTDDVDKLKISRTDFMNALDEVKPAFGVSEEELGQCIRNGIIPFNERIDRILEDGSLRVRQVRDSKRTPLVSLLLYGPPGSGKTALAARIAIDSQFPFVKLISPESMIGMSETAKVSFIYKIFSDSYRSESSVIVIDNIERILEWVDIGPRFSNNLLQSLMVLLKKIPPKNRKLLILATSSEIGALGRMGLESAFDASVEVPNIKLTREMVPILEQDDVFSSREIRTIVDYSTPMEQNGQMDIGVKKVLNLIEMARQQPEDKVQAFIQALENKFVDSISSEMS